MKTEKPRPNAKHGQLWRRNDGQLIFINDSSSFEILERDISEGTIFLKEYIGNIFDLLKKEELK